ncbi:hydrolase [Rothia nasimurium]|uniref:Hydrolase n=1 Tax=Rothia nasimurium TaxID=85336 RepID=A0A1Y1RRF0_9MICC|nr:MULTISPECIES: HAD family hydrolase [Rothia]ORC22604.1 hydrolase [Rothia nasimurium]
MRKLMAFDLDGTLIFERSIEPANIDAINRWQDAGNLAVCSTGKSIYATRVALQDYELNFDFNVLYTGAVITDRTGEILYQRTLDTSLVKDVIAHLSALDRIALFATTLDHDYQLVDTIGQVSNILPAFTQMELSDLENHEYVGIPIWSPLPETRQAAYRWITDTYGDVIDCHRNQDFLDIVPKKSTKGAGLEWLVSNYLGDQELETFSVGDSWNDLDMHRWADHAASFTYSPEEIQAETEYVVEKTYDFINKALTL